MWLKLQQHPPGRLARSQTGFARRPVMRNGMLLAMLIPKKVPIFILFCSHSIRFSVPSRSRFHRSSTAEKRGQKDGVDYGEYNERKKKKLREGQGNGSDSLHKAPTIPTKLTLSPPRPIMLHQCIIVINSSVPPTR